MELHVPFPRRSRAPLVALGLGAALLLMFANAAGAAVVPKVGLGAAGNFSVLAGAGVTNTGNTTMHMDLGSSPTPAITGFPPGNVIAPGVTDNAGAAAGQLALTTAYNDAHNRSLTATTTADLSGRTLVGGVYAATAKGPLSLTGTVTLNAQGDPNTVWIFQTDSTLITGSGSVVSLINGAQECNVYWQVLTSATLGSTSTFVGNILANTSITMDNGVSVHGRALARSGDVTLINDHFTNPTCATSLTPPTTTAPGGGSATSTSVPGSGAFPTLPGAGGNGTGSTTTSLGLTIGLVGPPVTGVAPLPSHPFPWALVVGVTVAGAAATGIVVRRRGTRHSGL